MNTLGMYSSALYIDAHTALERCLGLRQLFSILPPNVELSILLDNRIFATLTCHEQNLKLEPRESTVADIAIVLFPESIRRLRDNSPDDIMTLVRTFAELAALGHARIRLLSPVQRLYAKGYVQALKGLGPELQRDLAKYSFLLVGRVGQILDTIKSVLKR